MKQIKRIGVLSCAKVLGGLYLVLGLIFGGIMTIVAALGAGVGGGPEEVGMALGGGLASIIIIPLLYGFIGFIGGAFMAAIYNIAASMFGGIEFETTSVM